MHDLPDVWHEAITDRNHIHAKPIGLQKRLTEAVTCVGDVVVDPTAGGYSVLRSAREMGRRFLGCDVNG